MSIPGNGTANAQGVSGVECGHRRRGGVCHGERAPRQGCYRPIDIGRSPGGRRLHECAS
ncbi:MAG UNVERIFIED_CONTAM: hypothetical protein LVR18_39480 [Planctomycetaceae bacterium]